MVGTAITKPIYWFEPIFRLTKDHQQITADQKYMRDFASRVSISLIIVYCFK